MRMIGEKVASSSIPLESKVESKSSILGWIQFALTLLLVFILFKFVFGITIIDGHSMNPTFDNKDVILTKNLFYTAERNDVVIVKTGGGSRVCCKPV